MRIVGTCAAMLRGTRRGALRSVRSLTSAQRLAVVLLAGAAAASGCSRGGDPTSSSADAAPVDAPSVVVVETAHSDASRVMAVQFRGRLNAEVKDGKACLWMAGESIVWPSGSSAQVAPVRVLNAAGDVIATEGQFVLEGDGLLVEGQPGCHAGSRRWVLSEVRSAPAN